MDQTYTLASWHDYTLRTFINKTSFMANNEKCYEIQTSLFDFFFQKWQPSWVFISHTFRLLWKWIPEDLIKGFEGITEQELRGADQVASTAKALMMMESLLVCMFSMFLLCFSFLFTFFLYRLLAGQKYNKLWAPLQRFSHQPPSLIPTTSKQPNQLSIP